MTRAWIAPRGNSILNFANSCADTVFDVDPTRMLASGKSSADESARGGHMLAFSQSDRRKAHSERPNRDLSARPSRPFVPIERRDGQARQFELAQCSSPVAAGSDPKAPSMRTKLLHTLKTSRFNCVGTLAARTFGTRIGCCGAALTFDNYPTCDGFPSASYSGCWCVQAASTDAQACRRQPATPNVHARLTAAMVTL